MVKKIQKFIFLLQKTMEIQKQQILYFQYFNIICWGLR